MYKILPKQGLPRRKDEKDKPYIFLATLAQRGVVIPMDENGGVRIKKENFLTKKRACVHEDARL